MMATHCRVSGHNRAKPPPRRKRRAMVGFRFRDQEEAAQDQPGQEDTPPWGSQASCQAAVEAERAVDLEQAELLPHPRQLLVWASLACPCSCHLEAVVGYLEAR